MPLMCREPTIMLLFNSHTLQHPCETVLCFFTFAIMSQRAQKDILLAQGARDTHSPVLEPIFLFPFSTLTLTPDLFSCVLSLVPVNITDSSCLPSGCLCPTQLCYNILLRCFLSS